MPLSPPTEETRWRCALCGNLTRFDVERTVRSRDFVHVDLAGVAVVEEREIVGETIERVTCRWCGRADSVELVARPVSELPTEQVPAVTPAAPPLAAPLVAPPLAAPPVAPPLVAPPVGPAGPVSGAGEPYVTPVAAPVAGVVPVAGELRPQPVPGIEPVRPEHVDGDPVADAIAAAEPVAPPP